MGPKDLGSGQPKIDAISKIVEKSDLYVVGLSPEALKSYWVNHELKVALSLESTRGRPKVLPVLLADRPLPTPLRGRVCVDLTRSLAEAKPELKQCLENYFGADAIAHVAPTEGEAELFLFSVRFCLQATTVKYYGVPGVATEEEVRHEAAELVRKLRKRAIGTLLNFIRGSDIDFSELNFNAQYSWFPNGNLTDHFVEIEGDFTGSLKMCSIVEVEVLNPEERKLADLVSRKLDSLGVTKVIYSFLLSPPRSHLPQRSVDRLQAAYVITGYDLDEGAELELQDDISLSVRCTEEEIEIALEKKRPFLSLSKLAKEFSVRDFVDWLLKDKGSCQPVAAHGAAQRR
jgi:hypothetical protein